MNRYADLLEDERAGRVWTAEEAAEEVGLDPAFVARMLALIDDVNPTALASDDVAVLRALRAAIEAKFPEDALAQLVRVYGDALGRIAETEAHLFRFYIARLLATAGLSEPELAARLDETGRAADPLIEPLILYFHRRAFQRAIRRDAVVEVAEFAGLGPKTEHLTEIIAAVVFVDIASFTPLVEAVGDARATEILGRFSSLVRAEVAHRDGSVVKQIGDAFMLTFDRADSAVRAAVAIQAAAAIPENGIPALRAGVHWGHLLYWEGDYVGTTVNIASRLADDADEGEVIVSAAVRDDSRASPEVFFEPRGARRRRGGCQAGEGFAARLAGAAADSGLRPRGRSARPRRAGRRHQGRGTGDRSRCPRSRRDGAGRDRARPLPRRTSRT
jgi:class 3 adenylate cyclase